MKEYAKRLWNWMQFSDKTAPFIFFVVMLFSFGVYLPFTGFYWDDWFVVYFAHSHSNPWLIYPDRPFLAWPTVVIFPILNASPLISKLLYFIIRWLVVVCFWQCLRLIWPKAHHQNFCVALLFAVHPVFFQSFPTLTLETHFIAYLLYIISVILMLLAVKKQKWFYPLLFLSLIVGSVEMLTLEYFWGLELLRPVLLWMILSDQTISPRSRIKHSLLRWLPYLAIFLVIIIWRFFFLDYQGENTPTALIGLIKSPLSTIMDLAQNVLRDMLHILASTWTRTIDPLTINFSSTLSVVSWGLVFISAFFVSVYLYRTYKKDSETETKSPEWANQAIYIGFYAILVGMIPVWLTERLVSVGMWSDRLAIPALVGLCLVFIGFVFKLISKWLHQVLAIAILIGLAVGLQLRVGEGYRRDWNSQKAFYWQLYWRAPALKPGTSLLSNGGIFRYVTTYSLSSALNVLYPVPDGTTDLPLWAFELDNMSGEVNWINQLLNGMELQYLISTLSFTGSSENSIVISYNSNKPHCLWILTPLDANYPYLGSYDSQVLALTNLDQVIPEPVNADYPDEKIFGSEPEHGWCYFYEKADLARQYADWDAVTELGDQALELGYEPGDTYEWILFIEGYIHEKNWETAILLTHTTSVIDSYYRPALCAAWERSLDGMNLSPTENELVSETLSPLNCSR